MSQELPPSKEIETFNKNETSREESPEILYTDNMTDQGEMDIKPDITIEEASLIPKPPEKPGETIDPAKEETVPNISINSTTEIVPNIPVVNTDRTSVEIIEDLQDRIKNHKLTHDQKIELADQIAHTARTVQVGKREFNIHDSFRAMKQKSTKDPDYDWNKDINFIDQELAKKTDQINEERLLELKKAIMEQNMKSKTSRQTDNANSQPNSQDKRPTWVDNPPNVATKTSVDNAPDQAVDNEKAVPNEPIIAAAEPPISDEDTTPNTNAGREKSDETNNAGKKPGPSWANKPPEKLGNNERINNTDATPNQASKNKSWPKFFDPEGPKKLWGGVLEKTVNLVKPKKLWGRVLEKIVNLVKPGEASENQSPQGNTSSTESQNTSANHLNIPTTERSDDFSIIPGTAKPIHTTRQAKTRGERLKDWFNPNSWKQWLSEEHPVSK